MPIQAQGLRPGVASGTVAFALAPEARSPSILVLPEVESWQGAPGEPGIVGLILARSPSETARLPPGIFPVVGGCDGDLFESGDSVRIDGGSGLVEISGVTEHPVVTSILVRPDGRILLLKRSERVGSFRGRWAGVSGFLEESDPRRQALKEIREETGIPPSALTPLAEGAPVYSRDGPHLFVVHPFAYLVGSDQVRIDWEHTEFEWVDPGEIGRRPTVPKLDRVWAELETNVREALGRRPSGAKL